MALRDEFLADRLRGRVERVARTLTESRDIEVIPGTRWAAQPLATPQRLTYRLADTAVLGDELLPVIAHEIGHLLFTGPVDATQFKGGGITTYSGTVFEWRMLMINAIEDVRIEALMAEEFPGTGSLFLELHGPKHWSPNVVKGFKTLPEPWRFLFDLQRALRGIPMFGSTEDQALVATVLDDARAAVNSASTEILASHLHSTWDVLRNLLQNDSRKDSAKPDDGKEGGDDGNPGNREGGTGASPDDGSSSGVDNVDEKGEGGPEAAGSGDGKGSGSQDGEDADKTPSGNAGTSDQVSDDESGDRTNDAPNGSDDGDDGGADGDNAGGTSGGGRDVISTSLIDEMVRMENDRNNATIRTFKYRANQRKKQAKALEIQMRDEQAQFDKTMKDRFGKDYYVYRNVSRRHNDFDTQLYDAIVRECGPQIRAVHNAVQSRLRDNNIARHGGRYESGSFPGTSGLRRLVTTGAVDIFRRKRYIGGRSYELVLVIDQSTSMGGIGGLYNRHHMYNPALAQSRAMETAIILYEALREQMRLHVTGFYDAYEFPQYLQPDDPRTIGRRTLPLLRHSYGSTPTAQAVAHAGKILESSQAEKKAIAVVTDGMPNDALALQQIVRHLETESIPTYTFGIGLRKYPPSPQAAWDHDSRALTIAECTTAYKEITEPGQLAGAVTDFVRIWVGGRF